MYYAKIPCLRALELNGKSSQFLAIAVIKCVYFREKNIAITQFAFQKTAAKGKLEMSLLRVNCNNCTTPNWKLSMKLLRAGFSESLGK